MTIREILNTTEHRPWKIPTKNWKFYQEWNNAIFLHYQVDLDELKKFVPKELEIDLFDGKPWISVVAFTMEKIRPKNLPSFPPISDFDEINIRTYVKSNNKTGVYFLSIEFTIGNEINEKTELDKWLTERYALFQNSENSINEFEIHHLEWPINEIDLKKVELNYQRFDNLINNKPNKTQYSKGVKVIAWGKNKKIKTGYSTV